MQKELTLGQKKALYMLYKLTEGTKEQKKALCMLYKLTEGTKEKY